MTGIEACRKMVFRILKGEMSVSEVEKELERISEEYGEDESFNCYKVRRQPKPWNEETLEKLEILSASGAGSKEFYLHMAEVAEEVYAQKAKKKTRKIVVGILVVIVVIFAVFCVLSRHS